MRGATGAASRPAWRPIVVGASLWLIATLPAADAMQTPSEPQSPAELYAQAEQLFSSAAQSDSIPLFSRLIALLQPSGAGSRASDEPDLLVLSFYHRARAHLNLGDEDAARSDLQSLLLVQPGFEIERHLVSPKLAALFDATRSDVVGYLLLTISPDDAHITVDGVTTRSSFEPVALVAGTYEVVAARAGFARFRDTLEIPAGNTVQRHVVLERDSAVVMLYTRPSGAKVLLDGQPIGTTEGIASADLLLRGAAARYPSWEFSSRFVVDDLLLGSHEIEVQIDGYRPLRTRVQVDSLVDFNAGGLILEPLRGTIVLKSLPEGATVLVNGSPEVPRPAGSADTSGNAPDAPYLELAPGQYRITVTQTAGGMYEDSVRLLDRDLLTLDISLRLSVLFLGVLGGDEHGARTVVDGLREAMLAVDHWIYLERVDTDPSLAEGAGLTAAGLRDLAELASPVAGNVDWNGVQSEYDAKLGGSVYLLAVLSDDLLASHADLWVWPAAPGPSTPDRIRVPLEDSGSLARFVDRLERPFTSTRAWLGALVLDSEAGSYPIVFDITPNGPAEQAGVRIGDAIVAVDSVPPERAAEVRELIDRHAPGSDVTVGLRRGTATISVQITLGTSPSVIAPGDPAQAYAAVWAAGNAAGASTDATVPRWVAELNVAGVLMQARMWDAAVRRLRSVRVPSDSPRAQAMIDYYLGIALESIGPRYLENAREALSRAAAVQNARLLHWDGPYLAPRALARLGRLGGPLQRD